MHIVFLFYQCWMYGFVTYFWTHDPILSISTYFTILFIVKWLPRYRLDLKDKELQFSVHSYSMYCFVSGIVFAFILVRYLKTKKLVHTDPFVYNKRTKRKYLNIANGLFNILSMFIFMLAYYFLFGYYSNLIENKYSWSLGIFLFLFYTIINFVSCLYKETNCKTDDVYHLTNMYIILAANSTIEIYDKYLNNIAASYIIHFFITSLLFYPIFYWIKMRHKNYNRNVHTIFITVIVVHTIFHLLQLLVIQIEDWDYGTSTQIFGILEFEQLQSSVVRKKIFNTIILSSSFASLFIIVLKMIEKYRKPAFFKKGGAKIS